MDCFNISIGEQGLDKLKAVYKMFPQETQKATAQYLNDAARLFKDLAPKVIGSKYTIRNKGFANRQFKITQAKASDKMEIQSAQVFTEAYQRFSGWEEEITGVARPMRSTGEGHYHRLIWNTARGGNPQSQVKGQYRLRAGGEGYNSDILPDSRNYGLPIPQFLAMLSKSLVKPKVIRTENSLYAYGKGKRKAKKIFSKPPKKLLGKNKTFIMGGPGFPLGLYRIKGMEGTSFPEIEALQQFRETPPKAEKFDWRQMTTDKVKAWFNPEEVFKTYFVPILSQLWTKQ